MICRRSLHVKPPLPTLNALLFMSIASQPPSPHAPPPRPPHRLHQCSLQPLLKPPSPNVSISTVGPPPKHRSSILMSPCATDAPSANARINHLPSNDVPSLAHVKLPLLMLNAESSLHVHHFTMLVSSLLHHKLRPLRLLHSCCPLAPNHRSSHAEFLPPCCHHRHIDTNARINDQ
jgi:hypothetical protein